jgi:hypothetical protein
MTTGQVVGTHDNFFSSSLFYLLLPLFLFPHYYCCFSFVKLSLQAIRNNHTIAILLTVTCHLCDAVCSVFIAYFTAALVFGLQRGRHRRCPCTCVQPFRFYTVKAIVVVLYYA